MDQEILSGTLKIALPPSLNRVSFFAFFLRSFCVLSAALRSCCFPFSPSRAAGTTSATNLNENPFSFLRIVTHSDIHLDTRLVAFTGIQTAARIRSFVQNDDSAKNDSKTRAPAVEI